MAELPVVPRVADSIPAAPARRYVPTIVVVAIGGTLSILTWTRALDERQVAVSNLLGSLADEVTSTIVFQLEREVGAVRGLATFWQLHGMLPERTWRFDTRLTIEHLPGIQWIGWVPGDSTRTRIVTRDTTVTVDRDLLQLARLQRTTMSSVIQERWSDAYELQVLLPVGSPSESVSVLAASIRVDSLWFKNRAPGSRNVSLRLTSDRGNDVVLRAATDRAPPWMRLRRSFTSPAGSVVQAELVPWPDFVQEITTPWPHYFLMTGLFLSISLGLLLFQFMRTKDYTRVLARANLDLDERIAELSGRDRELRELNELLEQRVQERTAQLSAAMRELETFSHSASHDLRSPICAILNYAEVLREDFGPHLAPEGRHLLDRVEAAGQRANRLLSALMDFATSGAGPLQPQWVEVRSIAEAAYAEVIAAEPDGSEVRLEVGPLPAAIADPGFVHRVFSNLLGNALKYTRGRSPRVVGVGSSTNSSEATFWVRDNGKGFDPLHAADIFEPFKRIDGEVAEGSGLGLAIVAKMVRRQGGRVWARSDGMTGSTFYFTLPTREPAHGAEAPSRAVVGSAVGSAR